MFEIAIVGIGCRFPGGIHDPREFWEFLLRKGDGIVEVPTDRWSLDRYYDPDPDAPGRMYTRHGGFLTDSYWDFDPEYFGISPREASIMDPQQRLLLEVAVEALDDAGLGPRVGGGEVGVYIGGFTSDNLASRHAPAARTAINSHTPTSGSFTMLSNRLSYVLDLHGPSMTIDTACSSSLVAIHEAAQAIARGECDLALAGGANAMFQPETFISMCKGRFLSPDGRCKSFGAGADGYGRGEGAGIIVLRPLADARANGDRVYAVIRATGSNQDGRTSGITVPNPVAQEALARRVVAQSGVDPADIGYVEAHGTGTAVGDPLEIAALGAAYGAAVGRRSELVVGSVKNSFGHTEAAAGVAGVIKAALTVHHRTIAPQAHLDRLNPNIPFEELGIRIPTDVEPFPDDSAGGSALPAVAVNGFGYGGTNAHVVLVAAPDAAGGTAPGDGSATPDAQEGGRARVFPVSGRTEAVAREAAGRFADLLDAASDGDVHAVTDAAWARRVHHPARAAVPFTEPAELIAGLRAVADGSARAGSRTVVRDDERPVFVFTGMGPQWWRMARDLLDADGVFAATAATIDARFVPIAGWSIVDALREPEESSRVTTTEVAQPANFLVQVALTAELAAAGITPAAVLGHSVGEVSAAYLSGVLSLDDALLVSCHRARLQATTAGSGGMLAVGLPEAEIGGWLTPGSPIDVAAVNSPSSVALAGPVAVLEELAERLTEDGVFARALHVEVPYHSRLMDPILPAMAQVLAVVTPSVPTVPLFSSVTGTAVTDASWGAAYWQDNVRQPVRFAEAIGALVEAGHRLFVEIGPHPVLGGNIREILVRAGETGAVVSTLRRDRPDGESLAATVADLFVAGCVTGDRPRAGAVPHAPMPAYPWQRTRMWSEEDVRARDRLGTPDARPLLTERTAADAPEWESPLSVTSLPWLPDHVVDGLVVLPGAGYLDAALCAAAELTRRGSQALEDVRFLAPLVLDEHDVPVLQVAVETTTNRLRMRSRSAVGTDWTLNATGRIVDGRFEPGPVDSTPLAGADHVPSAELYAALAERGLAYGPAFRGIVEAWVGTDVVTAQVDTRIAGPGGHLAHPAVTDAALQCMAALLATDPDAPAGPVVPASIRSVRRFGAFTDQVHITVRRLPRTGLWADISVVGEDGRVALELYGVEFRPVRPGNGLAQRIDELFYEMSWELRDSRNPDDVPGETATEATVVVALGSPASSLAEKLAAGRPRVRTVELPGEAATSLDGRSTAALESAVRAALVEPGVERVLVAVVAGGDHGVGVASVAGLLAAARAVHAAQAGPDEQDDADGAQPPVHAVVVSHRAFGLPGDLDTPNLAHAGMIGARRELRNEQPALRWRLIDVDDDVDLDLLQAEVLVSGRYADDDADEVALRAGLRSVMRIDRSLARLREERDRPRPLLDPEANYRLEAPASRLLSDLRLRESERVAPGDGEIEIELESVGVSYKDAMKVMGVLTRAQMTGTYFGADLGMEAQGRIVRVGPDVTDHGVGDRMSLGERDLMSRYVTVSLQRGGVVRRAPTPWSGAGAASLVVFLTAHYALRSAARLQPGETVLIQGAAGGVGLAALQVAKRLGARVIATAGTPERRAVALAAGADHALDSRSLNFVDEVRALTDGRGVEVVLSSAPGEVVAANLASAAEFGRIVEVGKGGIYTNGVLPLAPFDRNLTFVAIDIDRMFAQRRAVLDELVDTVLTAFERGDYVELPTTTFPMSRAGEALEFVARAGQIGRVALTFDDVEPLVAPLRRRPIRSDATYLVTGGFGEVGLATARWLAGQGATHLALVGRRGAWSTTARAELATLADAGVEVLDAAVDVASGAAVRALVEQIEATMPPLRGVFHAAGILDDRPFTDVDAASLESVMDPKALGALNLQDAVAGLPLDHFVLYSSASAMTGNVPQVAYCAANTVLDTMAQARRADGLPALAVTWGSLAGGMAESSEDVRRYLATIGLVPIPLDVAMAALGECMMLGIPHVGVIDIDWSRWGATHPASATVPRFVDHIAAATSGGSQAALLRAELARLPEEQQIEVLGYMLAEQLSEVLGLPADSLDLTTPLPDLGLDSLMAVDLGARVSLTLGAEISALEFSRGLGLAGLARKILPTLTAPAAG